MPSSLWRTMRRGAKDFFERPQLWYTILVSVAIVASFLYVSSSFISIAKNAQDELVNVRIGAIQDSFAPLARHLWNDPMILRGYMRDIRALNPTISDFFIVQASSTSWKVSVSA